MSDFSEMLNVLETEKGVQSDAEAIKAIEGFYQGKALEDFPRITYTTKVKLKSLSVSVDPELKRHWNLQARINDTNLRAEIMRFLHWRFGVPEGYHKFTVNDES